MNTGVPPETNPPAPPPPDTVERWAWDFVRSDDPQIKWSPPEPPDVWADDGESRRLTEPGRPRVLALASKAAKTLGPGALQHSSRRAQLFHTFLHHELQAAELMAWALLFFADAPRDFRRGLLSIAQDEIRHLGLYRRHMQTLGFDVGDFAVRDWFWERVPRAQTPLQFVALMGMGIEGSNLDHTRRFAAKFREFGDETGARIQELVGEEEIAHVRFAAHWFEQFTGRVDFDRWASELPDPVSPSMLFYEPVHREARVRAGLPEEFVERLRQS